MKSEERIRRGVRQVQLLLSDDEHRRLKVHAALNGVSMVDLLRDRILDIVEPTGLGPASDPQKD